MTPWKQTAHRLESSNYTIHGLKASLLSWCSQLPSISEEMRRQQGHHKPVNASVRLYSRDDVHPQLQLQSILIREVVNGFRPCTPLHRGGQAPASEPPVVLERFQKSAVRTEWNFFYFPASMEEFVSPKLSEVIETALIEEEQLDEKSSSSSSSSSASDSEQESNQLSTVQPHEATGSQDPALYRFAMLRKTIHVISSWNQPALNSNATRMACGRQLVTSSLKVITYEELTGSAGSLCNHPGCRQIWSNFET